MQKNMKQQKTTFLLFAGMALIVFVFSLYFMTDFQDLFGLKTSKNALVAQFHDVSMQSANQLFFKFAVLGILTMAFALMLEVRTKIADKFALIALGVLCLVLFGFAVYSIYNLTQLLAEYRGLDLSYVDDEGGVAHIYSEVAFFVGMVIYGLNVVVIPLFYATLAKNHVKFVKEVGGE